MARSDPQDVHFSERGRQGRLMVLVAETGREWAFGADENTACECDNHHPFCLRNHIVLISVTDTSLMVVNITHRRMAAREPDLRGRWLWGYSCLPERGRQRHAAEPTVGSSSSQTRCSANLLT